MSDAAPQKASWLRHVLAVFGPLIGLIAVVALFSILRFDTFVTRDNFAIILQQTAVIAVAALGMTLIIIIGGIDLSVGSIIALGSVAIALLLDRGWSPLAAAAVGLGVSALCGACNGVFITRLNLLPFIVTLGTLSIVRGSAKRLAGEQPIYPQEETWLNQLLRLGPEGGVPIGVWLVVALAILVALMLHFTRFGRHIFAVGSNELTARLCGVPVERVKLLVYVLGGVFAGVAAILQFAYLTGGDPTTAVGLELNVIAAVVIGGASLSGGQGTITGTLVGALIMSVIANGSTKVGLTNSVQEIVTGGIIIAAALLDNIRRRSARS